ncbi:MAG TPA: cytochrome c, partial [Candidatus Binatia bacterium]|nr:cytochrome c [Candidatus Binatia bacterium]
TPCHGPSGGGDGPRAKELDPPPARFTGPVRMSGTAPYLFYNAITFGVANTAMASFADGLADQQRWDLAFFLWNFVLPPERRIPRGDVVLALRELATRASSDLAPEVVRQAAAQGETIDAAEAMVRVAQLRAYPPLLSDPQERLARLRQDLARSLALIDRNDTDAAADVVTTAYLTEFEPLEPEIDRRDSRIRQRFERGLIDFRGALRRNDRTAALATAKALTDTVDRAAELLGEDRGARTASRRLLYGGFTVAAFAIVVLTVWRIGKARAVR